MAHLGDIDRRSDAPPYRQIASLLRYAITSGALGPGDKLPSEAELMNHFGIARMTARQAVAELKSEGLVRSEHGRGVFVRDRPPVRRQASDRFARRHRQAGKAAFLAEAEQLGRPSVDQLVVNDIPAPDDVRERLRLRRGARVVERSRRYLIDDTDITAPDTGPGGVYARLEEAGHRLGRFTEEVSARMPTPEEAGRLDLPPGVPVLEVTRVAFDVEDTPVETTRTVKSAPRFVLEYTFPAE